MGTKIFKTLDEQIQILRAKGLVIDDIDYAKDVILRENYFFLMGYRHLFLENENSKLFKNGTTFRELYSLFYFDRQLRNIMFKNILIIENNCKSIFSYILSQKYGYRENEYLRPSNYNQSPDKVRQLNDLLKKMKRQIRVNGSQHEATKHYINNYGYIPLWVVVKVLSFGITSELYTVMKLSDQKEIAKEFNVESEDFGVFLPILSNYRNLCAHEDILFEHRTQKVIPDNKYHRLLDIPQINDEYIYGKGDLFSVVIIFKHILSKDDFRLFINEISYEIDQLSGRLNVISINKVLDRMGFPTNYKSLLEID
ncbi:MAG: Abi family protein [Erysipelotrichales bacterium]|nr:Abi family protein [Erysipelotrichales bacterium]